MRIVIVGCGKIGRVILRNLVRENHEIMAIDNDPEVIRHISDTYDVFVLQDSGTHFEALQQARTDQADIFIAATTSDEVNLLSCHLARELGARHTVARLRSQEYTQESIDFLRKRLGISMFINPELLTARSLYNTLRFPSAVKCESFARRFEMVEMTLREDSPLSGVPLFRLREKIGSSFLVGAVLRDGEAHIPGGDFMLQSGDRIGVLATPEDMFRLLRSAGDLQKAAHDIMLLGGSGIARHLAEMLSRGGCRVKLIEQRDERCQELCSLLPRNVTVICADGSHQSVLVEEGLEHSDAFVTLTGSDEKNVLLAACAKTRGVPKVIAKVNQDSLMDMSDSLNVDLMVSARAITADVMVQYVRAVQNSCGSNVETLYRLMNGAVEALEFRVSPEFPKLGIPLRDLRFKKGVLIAGILRGSHALIPGGGDTLEADDRVIVISAGRTLLDLSGALL